MPGSKRAKATKKGNRKPTPKTAKGPAKARSKSVRKETHAATSSAIRLGGTRVTVENSGLEVWLYDDANRETIASAGPSDDGAGGMPPAFEASTCKGLIVGYSLYQDDG